MTAVSTTQMSSKGQVVIPEELRNRLDLKPGTRFVVVGQDDCVVLKTIQAPTPVDFDRLIAQARRQASEAGMKPSDIRKAVEAVRREKRRKR